MSATRTLHDVKILGLTRLNNSTSGNPRWLITLSDGTSAPTAPDADAGYGAENSEYQDTPLTVEMQGGQITKIARQES